MAGLRLFILLALTLTSIFEAVPALASMNQSACAVAFSEVGRPKKERIFGREVSFRKVDESELKLRTFPTSHLETDHAVFFGIMPNGHSYLVVGDRRYDGETVFQPPMLRRSLLLSDGVVIRIADRDGSLRAAIEDVFNRDAMPAGFTCVSSLCKTISHATHLQFVNGPMKTMYPNVLFEKLIKNEVVDRDGRELKSDIFVLGHHSLKGLQAGFIVRTSTEIAKYSVSAAAFFGIPAALITMLVF